MCEDNLLNSSDKGFMFLNIACGSTYIANQDWLNLDYSPDSDYVTHANLLGRLPLNDSSVDFIYSSHFVEHIPTSKLNMFFTECLRILKPGGYIRLVLPDLDELCQEYLLQRGAGNNEKAHFITLELIDQCVRNEPGGALAKYYKSILSNKNSEILDYIKLRTGEDLRNMAVDNDSLRQSKIFNYLKNPKETLTGLERLYCRLLVSLLPSAFREQNISLTSVGEKHAWVYDFSTLSSILNKLGFNTIEKLNFNNTNIPDFPLFPLDYTSDGFPRKGQESMYIEASKPSI